MAKVYKEHFTHKVEYEVDGNGEVKMKFFALLKNPSMPAGDVQLVVTHNTHVEGPLVL